MDEEKVNSLIIKKFADEISNAEEQELQTWLSDSKTNQEMYQGMQKLWNATVRKQETDVPDIDVEWHKLEHRLQLNQAEKTATVLEFKQRATRKENKFLQARWYPFYAIAAVLLLYFGITLFDGNQQILESTRYAETKSVTLPDGSEVRLNNDSRISYTRSFSDGDRTVHLQGEAFFTVVKNSTPFVVKTENARVRVLGTEFNVWARNEETRITVRNGKVSVQTSGAEENEGLVLTANQMAVSKQGQTLVLLDSSIDAKAQIGWLEGRILFNETGLQEVVEELGRIYDLKIELQNTNLQVLSISGSFEKKPIEEILEAICLTLDLRYEKVGGKFVLEGM